MKTRIKKYLNQHTDAAPLAVFRIFFGAIMLFSMLRFQYYGWIEKLYIEPRFFFSYLGFEWVKPFGEFTYLFFLICGISAFCVMLGWKYRIAIITFFLSFTYIELMDKTNYLNHYYFVSCLSFMLIFLPGNARFSVDFFFRKPTLRKRLFSRVSFFSETRRKKKRETLEKSCSLGQVPKWTIDSLKFMLCIVWFYAGLAKLNSDWLLEAQPLKIWLKAKYDIPILGDLLQKEIFHYLFSWGGAIYDLTIGFLLWNSRTRPFAFVAVVIFHVLTWILFPIGVFPWVMIGSALVFFRWDFLPPNPLKGVPVLVLQSEVQENQDSPFRGLGGKTIITTFLILQLLLPFRHLLYNGELFWTEEGYRFSWRVMLMEKAGYANFKVVDPENGKRFYVQNGNFLTPLQEKQMATQPDMILEFAHYLDKHYRELGIRNPEIYVESFVALNGRSSQPFIDPNIDLTTIKPSWKSKTFILPFNDEIKGF